MTPEELRREQILSEQESANAGSELLASVQGLDPSEQVRRLKQTGFGVARPPTPEEMAAREQSQDFPANGASGFTPPPAPNDIDYSSPVQPRGRRGRNARAPIANQEPDIGMSAGEVFRASMNPQFAEGGMSYGDVYRASMGAHRDPAPTAQEIYGDTPFTDIFGAIKDGVSNFFNPPPRDPGSTRGGQKRANQTALDAIRTVAGEGDEPTGTQPVATQGEPPVADAVSQNENASIESQAALPGAVTLSDAGVVDVTDVPYSDFTDPSQMPTGPDALQRSVLPLPPTAAPAPDGVPPEQGQAVDGAEPGQQSLPEGGLDRVRIHRGLGAGSRVTDAIVNDPDPTTGGLAGLEGPAGLSDKELVKFARLQAQGIRGETAQNLLLRQKQVEAETTRANASQLTANAKALGFVDAENKDGSLTRMFYRVDDNGDLAFINTDISARFEPRVGSQTIAHMDGSRETTPVVVYPSVNEFTGEIMPDNPTMIDLTRWGSAQEGDERAQEILEFIRRARERRWGQQEIEDALDAEFAGE